MCSCPLTTTKNLVTCLLSSTMISFCSTIRCRPCARARACWAEVRTGNISLGVLPGGGDKASSASGRFDILSYRLEGGSKSAFRRSSLLRLVDERDEPWDDLLRRLLHQPMTFALDDHSVDVRVDEACLLDQEVTRCFLAS